MQTLNTLTRTDLSLRWLVHLDMPQVVRISQQGAGLHWAEEEFLEQLRSINTIGLVAERADQVVGYVVYQIRRRPVEEADPTNRITGFLPGVGEGPRQILLIDLLNITVSPEFQRQGIGRMMLNKLEQKIQREGGCIRTAVPESNLAAQLFLRDAGYRAIRVLRDYYDDEDAYLMERRATKR